MRELLNTGVSINLEYYPEHDALIGQIKGFAVAVKENLSTGSYGCLFWVKKSDSSASGTAEQYLEQQKQNRPDFLKKYMINDTGVAVALNRTSDDFVNINNLKRFIYDFVSFLSANSYENCCCECGSSESLSIYETEGAIAQACSACGVKYIFIRTCTSSSVSAPAAEAVVAETSAPVQEETAPAEEKADAFDEADSLFEKIVASTEEIPAPAEEKTTVFDEAKALLDEITVPAAETSAPAQEVAASTEEKTDAFDEADTLFEKLVAPAAETSALSKEEAPIVEEAPGLSTEKEEENPFSEFEYKPEEKKEEPVYVPAPAAETEEFSLKEFEFDPDEKTEEPVAAPVSDEPADLSDLMFDESHKAEEPAVSESVPVVSEDPAENFGALLYEEAKPEPERPRSRIFEEAEREFAEEKARMAAEEAKLDSKVDDLLIENDQIVLREIGPEIDDGSNDVTEVYDDSNDGEDFDIEEIESTVEKPTVTTGHPQLEAEDTPLEEDGSVPLINPNSHREERQVSAVDGPDAVQPLDYGQTEITYEKLSEETAPRFSAGGEINRGYGASAPPPFNPDAKYSSYSSAASFADKSNGFMGIIGALVLGLVGIAVWIAIAHFFSVISAFGCLAIILTVYGGYRLGGGSLDKKGIVISFIITLLMVIAGIIGMSMVSVIVNFKEEYDLTITLSQAFDWTISMLKAEETRKAFISDAIVSLGATLVGNIIAAVSMWKKA